MPVFYKECRRILKPTGALAAWGYGLCDFPGNARANALLHDYYTEVVGPYWDDRRQLIDDRYKGDLSVCMLCQLHAGQALPTTVQYTSPPVQA